LFRSVLDILPNFSCLSYWLCNEAFTRGRFLSLPNETFLLLGFHVVITTWGCRFLEYVVVVGLWRLATRGRRSSSNMVKGCSDEAHIVVIFGDGHAMHIHFFGLHDWVPDATVGAMKDEGWSALCGGAIFAFSSRMLCVLPSLCRFMVSSM